MLCMLATLLSISSLNHHSINAEFKCETEEEDDSEKIRLQRFKGNEVATQKLILLAQENKTSK